MRGMPYLGKELRAPTLNDEARKALFGQTAQSVQRGEHKNRESIKKRDPND